MIQRSGVTKPFPDSISGPDSYPGLAASEGPAHALRLDPHEPTAVAALPPFDMGRTSRILCGDRVTGSTLFMRGLDFLLMLRAAPSAILAFPRPHLN